MLKLYGCYAPRFPLIFVPTTGFSQGRGARARGGKRMGVISMVGKSRTAMIAAAGSLALLMAAPAIAADMPVKAPVKAAPTPAWDVAITAGVMSDYIFRGVTQSEHGAAVTAAFELQLKKLPVPGELYLGIGGYSVELSKVFTCGGCNAPSAEIDIFGGWRNTWGKFSLDIGYIYYYYPSASPDIDWSEVYAKLGYNVTDKFSVGASLWYSVEDILNNTVGVKGTYGSLTAKYVLPDINPRGLGWFVSGEYGHYWLDSPAPDYNYWNLGVAFTYKAFTLDLRYHDTDLSNSQCGGSVVAGVGTWCGERYVATLSFATNLSAIK